MAIRQYYGKQCNAVNFPLLLYLYNPQLVPEMLEKLPVIAFRLPSKYSHRLGTDSNPLIFYLHRLHRLDRQSVLALAQAWATQSHRIIKEKKRSFYPFLL